MDAKPLWIVTFAPGTSIQTVRLAQHLWWVR